MKKVNSLIPHANVDLGCKLIHMSGILHSNADGISPYITDIENIVENYMDNNVNLSVDKSILTVSLKAED